LTIDPPKGAVYNLFMRVIAKKTLREFWNKHPAARQALQAWFADAQKATWNSPADIKLVYRNASFISNNRVVFNIKGNQYRIIVAIHYDYHIVYIRFVGTHSEYSQLDAARI
jgi:mRNA interferase HigB